MHADENLCTHVCIVVHGSIGELFQMAGQVGKAVGQFVSVVSDQSQTS